MLSETRNLLRLAAHAAGRYHTPAAFHRWATLSLCAAAVGDRVYLVRFRHTHLFPNLFVFLVGGSGLGKDHAIGHARSLVDPEADATIQTFPGRLTQALLSDQLVYNQARKDKPPGQSGAATWLVQSELFADLPGGELTKALVADLVRLYQGSGSDVVLNATRMHGIRRVSASPVINWLAGSTVEWFAKSITPDVFDSGFAGRSIFVCEERDYDQRFAEPIYPDDHREVVEHLVDRVLQLSAVYGRFGVDSDALAIEEGWVLNRPAPTTELEAKIWDRQHVMSLKLAMLLVLVERSEPLVIEGRHMAAAQRLVADIMPATGIVAAQVHASKDAEAFRRLRAKLQRGRRVDRTWVLREAATQGMMPAQADMMLKVMLEANEIRRERTGTARERYVWVGEEA